MAKRDIKSIEPFIFLSKQITILKESPTHFQFIANPYTNPPRKFKYNPLSHNLLLTTHNSSPITRHKHQSHTRPQPTQKRSRLSPTKKVVRYLRRTLRQRARAPVSLSRPGFSGLSRPLCEDESIARKIPAAAGLLGQIRRRYTIWSAPRAKLTPIT